VTEQLFSRGEAEKMGFRHRTVVVLLAGLVGAGVLSLTPPPMKAGITGGDGTLQKKFLDIPLICSRTLEQVTLARMATPRAAVLLFSGAQRGPQTFTFSMKVIAPLVRRYGDHIDWYRIMVQGTAGAGDRFSSSCPVLFRSSLYDSEGRLAAALGVTAFPAVVIIERDGRVVRSMDGVRYKDIVDAEKVLRGIQRARTLEGKPARDFRLPAAGSGWPLCLLDTVSRDYTMFLFLTAGSDSALVAIRALEEVRNRNRSAAGLVAVFRDRGADRRVADFLRDHGLHPDYALFDTDMRLSSTYGVSEVPVALLVVGPKGRIVFSMVGFEPPDAAPIGKLLEGIFSRATEGTTPFRDARRIHAAAQDWLREGRKEMALLYLERVLELYPELHSVNYVMADIYSQMGKRREAARCYSRSLAAGVCDLRELRSRLKTLLASPQ